ncbi:type II toxin-antitoxin system ParD family antitoxin, partial [Dietzia cinnamea]|uniref:type II toxin-antitoxin system ParD family antitoxin n=1 Tax=Dietzia cinnamea TaxID=321318 RepID=UPI0021A95B15
MAPEVSIRLDSHFTKFVAREVASGRYRSTSEVVQAGLRLLEVQQTRMASLRSALADGEASGTPERFDFDAFVAAKRRC